MLIPPHRRKVIPAAEQRRLMREYAIFSRMGFADDELVLLEVDGEEKPTDKWQVVPRKAVHVWP
jgi:hypothetical protein